MHRPEPHDDENLTLLDASGAPNAAEFWRCCADVDWSRLELALLANDATIPQDRYETRHILAGTALASVFASIFLGLSFACFRDPGAIIYASAVFLGAACALAFFRQLFKISQAVINREGRAFSAAFHERMDLQPDSKSRPEYVESALFEIAKNRKIDMAQYHAGRFLEYRALRSIRYGKEAAHKSGFAEAALLHIGAALRAATGAEKFIHVAALLDEETAWRLVEKDTPAEFHRLESVAIASAATQQLHQDCMPGTARRL